MVNELCVGRLGGDEDFKVHYYALPSSTLTAWGLMAPVRAGLAWPVEVRGSWSLLVMPPDGVLPSPTALRTSLIVLFCTKKTGLIKETAVPGKPYIYAPTSVLCNTIKVSHY